MISYKQWKLLEESFDGTFSTILTTPHSVGGVIGANGASLDPSLEVIKERIKKYMFGDDEEGEGDKKFGKPMGKPGKFGGNDEDDDDMDDDSMGGDDDDDMDDAAPDHGDEDDDDDDDMDDDSMGGDEGGSKFGDEGDEDMSGDDDDMDGDSMGGGMDDMKLGGGDDDDMNGGAGFGGGAGANAKGHVCEKCGHHEPDKNAKFCKMCGDHMSKFMKKFMSKDEGKSSKGKKCVPWLNKTSKNGEIKKGGKETAKEMFTTVKGGKKEGEKKPAAAGGKVKATKLKKEHLCMTCGNLACEIHNGVRPSADRLNKSFFQSLSRQIGTRGGKWDDGIHDTMAEDALYSPDNVEPKKVPGPGEVGFAPQSRIGTSFGN